MTLFVGFRISLVYRNRLLGEGWRAHYIDTIKERGHHSSQSMIITTTRRTLLKYVHGLHFFANIPGLHPYADDTPLTTIALVQPCVNYVQNMVGELLLQ